MSYLVDNKKTHRIMLSEPYSVPIRNDDGTITDQWQPPFNDSEDWVEIQDQLTDHEILQIQTRAETMQLGGQAAAGVRITATNYERRQLAVLGKAIKSWSLADDGRPLPLNEDTFRRLGPVGTWLYDAIDAHYAHARLTPEQVKNFVAAPSPSTSAAGRFLAGSNGSTSPNGTGPRPIESTSYPTSTAISPGS